MRSDMPLVKVSQSSGCTCDWLPPAMAGLSKPRFDRRSSAAAGASCNTFTPAVPVRTKHPVSVVVDNMISFTDFFMLNDFYHTTQPLRCRKPSAESVSLGLPPLIQQYWISGG